MIDRADVFERIPFLRDLAPEERADLAACFRRIEVPRDHPIIQVGDYDLKLYILVEGRVKIFKNLPGGDTVDIAAIGGGECFGEMAFIDSKPRSAGAVTLTDCVIDTVAREDFQAFRARHPLAGYKIESGILQMTIQRLRKTSDRFSYQAVFGNFIKSALERSHEDLKVANDALVGANRFLRAVLDASPDLIVFIDNDAKITLYNRGAEEITGYREEEMKGRLIDTLFPSSAIEGLRRRMEGSISVRNYETGMRRRDGRIVPVNLSAATMSEWGEPVGAVIAGQDLTEKKVLEEQVIQSEKLALLGQLAGEVVHEIKNPVHNIMMALSYLRQNLVGAINREVDDSVRIIDQQVDRIHAIVRNILMFMRPRDDEKAIFPAREVAEAAAKLARPEFGDRRVTIRVEAETGLERLYGNRGQFTQLFLNLYQNALNAMAGDGEIVVAIRTVDGRLHIAVEDTAGGFAAEALPHVFKPFFTTRRAAGGTGLGLSICKNIVEQHGGFISAENGARGAIVRFSFLELK